MALLKNHSRPWDSNGDDWVLDFPEHSQFVPVVKVSLLVVLLPLSKRSKFGQ